jgi:hypothetical protein
MFGCSTNNPAVRRYLWRFAWAMFFYVVCLIGSILAFVHLHPTGVVAYGLAVLPALPMIGMTVVVGLYLSEEKDEFQRNMTIQALLGGIGGTLSVVSVWGFLESFVHIRHLDLIQVYPMFWMFVFFSVVVVRLRYR